MGDMRRRYSRASKNQPGCASWPCRDHGPPLPELATSRNVSSQSPSTATLPKAGKTTSTVQQNGDTITETEELSSSSYVSTVFVTGQTGTSTITPRATTQQPMQNISPRKSATGGSANVWIPGISTELFVVSLVAGLCLLCAIVAIAVACHLKKKYKSDRPERNNTNQSAAYVPIDQVPGNPAFTSSDSTAENPTYAEIGELVIAGTPIAVASTVTQSPTLSESARERLTSATPLIPDDGYAECLNEKVLPPHVQQSYQELTLKDTTTDRQTLSESARERLTSATQPLISDDGYAECLNEKALPPRQSYQELKFKDTVVHINEQDKETNDVRPSPSETNTGYVDVDYSTSETDYRDEGHQYVSLRPQKADAKDQEYVDVDYSSHDERLGDTSQNLHHKHVNCEDNTAISLTCSPKADNGDGVMLDAQNGNPFYFTLGKEHLPTEDLKLQDTVSHSNEQENKTNDVRSNPSKKDTGYVDVDYSTSETDSRGKRGQYVSLRPQKADVKDQGYVDVDYSSHDERLDDTGQNLHPNGEDNTVISLTCSQNADNGDGAMADAQNGNPFYFTLGDEHLPTEVRSQSPEVVTSSSGVLSTDTDTVQLLKNNPQDEMSNRPNNLDLSINERFPRTNANFGRGIERGSVTYATECITNHKGSGPWVDKDIREKIPGKLDAYQKLPLISPCKEDDNMYQKLNRGAIANTLSK